MADVDKDLMKMESELKSTETPPAPRRTAAPAEPENKGTDHELLQFFMGFLLLGGGIYWVLNSFTVHSGWGVGYYSFFGMRISGGVMLIPLLVGIGLLFFMDKKVIGGCVSALGLLVILISLLSSLSFTAKYGSLYVYVLMFAMIAAGAGLLIRVLFKKR